MPPCIKCPNPIPRIYFPFNNTIFVKYSPVLWGVTRVKRKQMKHISHYLLLCRIVEYVLDSRLDYQSSNPASGLQNMSNYTGSMSSDIRVGKRSSHLPLSLVQVAHQETRSVAMLPSVTLQPVNNQKPLCDVFVSDVAWCRLVSGSHQATIYLTPDKIFVSWLLPSDLRSAAQTRAIDFDVDTKILLLLDVVVTYASHTVPCRTFHDLNPINSVCTQCVCPGSIISTSNTCTQLSVVS